MRTAINVYSVRELDEPIEAVVDRVAAAGYDGIQFTGEVSPLAGDPARVADALVGTDLAVTPPHVGMDALVTDREAVLAAFEPFDVSAAVVPAIAPEHFRTATDIVRVADRVDRVATEFAADGWDLHYHNHAFEYVDVDGECAFDRFVRGTDVGIELDVGWAHVGGDDPADRIRDLGDRAQLLHLKDVDANGEPCEIGEGVVDMAACAAAAGEVGTDWFVYEHDRPDDPVRSLEHGATFLASLFDSM